MADGFTGPADDIAAIRALHDCYADAVNRVDAEGWASLWAEDAVWNLMGHEVSGRAAIGAMWKGAMAGFSFVGFFSQPGAIVVSGNRGEGRVWTHEILVDADGERRPLGQYEDQYVKQDGSWLFQQRRFSLRRP